VGAGIIPLTNGYTLNVAFNKPPAENVKVSLPPAQGDQSLQAVMNTGGNAIGGKYNPVNNTVEARLNSSETLTVRERRMDFGDIANKSREMQNAINVLASKGIINGTSPTTFNPDGRINRAEIAALITRTLSKYDANADGRFTDVTRSNWFFGAVGSARRHEIMRGTSDTIFSPMVNIPKDQIVAVSARVLRNEMRYRDPSNISGVLSTYTDAGAIPEWARIDVALATRENLVVRRTDGAFNGTATMTRGEAALILYRMFMKIW